ncbi:prepilin-type N-terminal cleavage/methylation domain-containing protein [bacterium]|nr:prepilin-type N-terminal cleavage/methylation domain-containing protein [candidate division CSSED10-310 bacterium]
MTRHLVHCRGFTLVELLIAITLTSAALGLIASAWWMTVRFQTRLDDASSHRIDPDDRLRLHRYVGAVDRNGQTGTEPSFQLIPLDSGQHLTARIIPGAFDPVPDYAGYSRLIVTTNISPGLQMDIHPATLGHNPEETPPAVTGRLLESGGPVTIHVLGIDDQWYDRWSEPDRKGLPRAVRFRQQEHPDVIIPLNTLLGDCGAR